MRNEEANLTPGDRELEAALGGLAPAAVIGLTMEKVSMRALVDRERRRTRVWQAVAALLAVAAGAGFLAKPAPRVVEVERVVLRDRERAGEHRWVNDEAPVVSPKPAAGDYAYLRLRDQVLANGVESLRASRGAAAPREVELGTGRRTRVEIPTLVEYLFSGGRS
ncbi:MAG: hypothetical protein JWN40_5407 [Phycisphaerales bacterium]|nr:hypothetical protein [Phycisphaerales bacterium]